MPGIVLLFATVIAWSFLAICVAGFIAFVAGAFRMAGIAADTSEAIERQIANGDGFAPTVKTAFHDSPNSHLGE